MRARVPALILGLSALPVAAMAQSEETIVPAEFTESNAVKVPEGYRHWVFVGAPVTPNALNDGEAPFPEFHNVYVEPSAFAYYSQTGTWAEGTQIVKELVTVLENDNDEIGASFEVSGRGYQQGEFSGLELTVKDRERFSEMPGGWAYFTFGHHGPPYAQTAEAEPAENCNACHEASAAADFVFTQFYPVLRAAHE